MLDKFIQFILRVQGMIQASRIIVQPEGVGLSMIRNIKYKYGMNKSLRQNQS